MDSGILGSKKLGLLDRDPFRGRHAESPVYRRPSEEMPNILFADDDPVRAQICELPLEQNDNAPILVLVTRKFLE